MAAIAGCRTFSLSRLQQRRAEHSVLIIGHLPLSSAFGELDDPVHRIVDASALAHGIAEDRPSSATVRPATPRPPRTIERPRGLVFSLTAVLSAATSCMKRSTSSRLTVLTGIRPSKGTMCRAIRPRSEISVDSVLASFRRVSSLGECDCRTTGDLVGHGIDTLDPSRGIRRASCRAASAPGMARWARSTSIARNNWSLDAGAFGAKMTYATGQPSAIIAERIIRMNHRGRRPRTTLLLGTAFLAGVAIGPASSLIASHFVLDLGINAAFAQDTDRANTYRLLTLFGDVFERVRSQYVDPVSDKELIENAVNGMLTGLDPHSSYMNAEQFREMQVETKGEFGGLGIEVIPENGFFKVIGANGRHACVQGRYQGRRHHHRDERQDSAGAVTGGCARPDARPTELEGHADDQA